MSIRKILVPVDGSEAARPALQTGFAVAIHLSAHVDALHVRIEPAAAVSLVGEGMSGALIQDLIDLTDREAASRAVAARAMFEELAASSGLAARETPAHSGASARFVERRGREDEEIIRYGRLADLLVVARSAPRPDTAAKATFDAAIFETGGAVLVGPAAAVPNLSGRILVFWNDTPEAARVLKHALPLLRRAETVEMVSTAAEPERERAFSDVADYLSWHGITAGRRHVVPRGAGSEGAALAEACRDADLVVMGAYTHSRLRQLILGSVTRHMLEETPLTLLMAH